MVGAAVTEGDGDTLSLRFSDAETEEQPLTVFERSGDGVEDTVPD